MIESVYKDAEGAVYIHHTQQVIDWYGNATGVVKQRIRMSVEEAKELIDMLTHCLERE